MKPVKEPKMTLKELFEIVPPNELKDSINFLLFQHLKHSPTEELNKKKVYEDIQLLFRALD